MNDNESTQRSLPNPDKQAGRKPRSKAISGPDQYTRFLEAARELGADPHDPRIRDVLRGMAAQGPKPHAEEPKRRKKAREDE
ncbi:MAG: hypothetical protein KDG89_10880 [Geminicoccaceae bacterium]|nr:hypothetical protein [Geminicoccaceae bacterium]